jgi:hypothetical protein
MRHRRSLRLRGFGENLAASGGLGFEQPDANASNRASDMGCWLSQTGNDDQRSSLRRTESRTMAGDESCCLSCKPSRRQSLVCRYRRACAERRKLHGFVQPRLRRDRAHRHGACGEGRDRGHGGTIKAAIGLALGGQPEKGLAFDIDNCSVTRLDHIASSTVDVWRLPMVNQQPWMADAAHKAMHQPAGPEVTTSKLA